MGWFAKSAETTETLPQQSHLKHDELRLIEVDRELRVAEKTFSETCLNAARYAKLHRDPTFLINDKVYVGVNSMSADPERARLEGAKEQARAQRNELLAERARLLKDLKLIR